MIHFQNNTPQDYENLRQFFLELNRVSSQNINWNWARFEWMMEHPLYDKESACAIGLWLDGKRIVGAAVYDMYFGEGFCGVLPDYKTLYPEILDYAYTRLKDESGFGLAVCDDNTDTIRAVTGKGFVRCEQDETVMCMELTNTLPGPLPAGFSLEAFDPAEEPCRFQWLLWQGFDHGTDRTEFEREDPIVPQRRPNLRKELSIAAVDSEGESAAYCCVWYDASTDYAYVEPVCVIPQHRGKGLGRAGVAAALNRAAKLGARRAYVISDQAFYERLGFRKTLHWYFYHKN